MPAHKAERIATREAHRRLRPGRLLENDCDVVCDAGTDLGAVGATASYSVIVAAGQNANARALETHASHASAEAALRGTAECVAAGARDRLLHDSGSLAGRPDGGAGNRGGGKEGNDDGGELHFGYFGGGWRIWLEKVV